MGKTNRGHTNPAASLRKVINCSIFRISLSETEKAKYFELVKSLEPRKAVAEILKALKLSIKSEGRAAIFQALLHVREKEGTESISDCSAGTKRSVVEDLSQFQ